MDSLRSIGHAHFRVSCSKWWEHLKATKGGILSQEEYFQLHPVWQSLGGPGFLPGSGIFFLTIVEQQSYTVEVQDDETTKAQILGVLRNMYGSTNVPLHGAYFEGQAAGEGIAECLKGMGKECPGGGEVSSVERDAGGSVQ